MTESSFNSIPSNLVGLADKLLSGFPGLDADDVSGIAQVVGGIVDELKGYAHKDHGVSVKGYAHKDHGVSVWNFDVQSFRDIENWWENLTIPGIGDGEIDDLKKWNGGDILLFNHFLQVSEKIQYEWNSSLDDEHNQQLLKDDFSSLESTASKITNSWNSALRKVFLSESETSTPTWTNFLNPYDVEFHPIEIPLVDVPISKNDVPISRKTPPTKPQIPISYHDLADDLEHHPIN